MKRFLALTLALVMALSLTACGGKEGSQTSDPAQGGQSGTSGETIALRVWGAEEDQALLKDLVEKFKQTYSDQTFDIQIGVESESKAKDDILTDVTAAADVKAANTEASIGSSTLDGILYAFPFSSDGYFMFYDPSVISEEQSKSWDTLLAAAQAGGKKVGMTLASGWYLAGFYYGAGFTTSLNPDGTTAMDWNGTAPSGVTGAQVTQAILNITSNPAFMAVNDGDSSNQLKSGSLSAIISGCWDSQVAAEIWGDGYMAGPMPSFTAGGQEVPGGAVASYKLMGVNPHSQNTGWAVLLAEFLCNEESQVARYTARQLPPTNIAAAADPAVAADKGVAGLAAQSASATLQFAGGKYWDPVKSFGEQLAQGTIKNDETSAQAALDELVAGVTAPIS